MVYAICSDVAATFTMALGRDLSWGFDRTFGEFDRLRLRPHFAEDRNDYYHKESGELRFGQFLRKASPAPAYCQAAEFIHASPTISWRTR
jgi:hypothetical protein